MGAKFTRRVVASALGAFVGGVPLVAGPMPQASQMMRLYHDWLRHRAHFNSFDVDCPDADAAWADMMESERQMKALPLVEARDFAVRVLVYTDLGGLDAMQQLIEEAAEMVGVAV